MNELHQKILDDAKDEVLRDHKIEMTWNEYIDTFPSSVCIPDFTEEAALLAMEEQAEFFRWCCAKGITLGVGKYENEHVYAFPEGAVYTEMKLFNLWKEEKG